MLFYCLIFSISNQFPDYRENAVSGVGLDETFWDYNNREEEQKAITKRKKRFYAP